MRLAICIISYNRPESVSRVLRSVNNGIFDNDKVDLIISIDYSGDDSVEIAAKAFDWQYGEKKIISHEHNLGLRKHILQCGDLTKEYDGLIVLEDDIFVAPSFYLYAKACVTEYLDRADIAGISLYSFNYNYHNSLPFIPLGSDSDVYMMQNSQSWGQVWMPRQWEEFKKWYSKNNDDFPEMPHLPKSICSWKRSWLKYHTRYCIENDKYFIYPYLSLSTCFSDVGEHTSNTNYLIQVPISGNIKRKYDLNPNIKYDAFFENVGIYDIFPEYAEDICIDLYGEKGNREKNRYWLTREVYNYKILRTYGLSIKPIENNILMNIAGTDIYLYDTHVSEPNRNKYCEIKNFRFFSNINFSFKILKAIIKNKFSHRLGLK